MSYKLPDTPIEDLSLEDIEAEVNKALDAYNALGKITDESSDEDIDAAIEIQDAIQVLTAEKAKKVEASEAEAAEEAAKAAERAEKVARAAEAPVVPATEPEAETPAEDPPAETPEVEQELIVPDEVTTPEPVAASAGSSNPVARAAANATEVHVPQTRAKASLVAAADVPRMATGAELDGMAGVTQAILNRADVLPKRNLATAHGGVRQRYGAALIHKQFDEDLRQETKGGSDLELVWNATNPSRLPGGSLVAAGGWCAPSETVYDLCQYETVEGILDVPEMEVRRGGLRWTQGPTFDDIYTACGFQQTEAEAIAGDTKDCCTVDCPEFDEIRLDAIGLCIKSPILTEHAYPELTQRFVEGALVAHQHKVNKYIIDAIALAAGTSSVSTSYGATRFNLQAVEYSALAMRYSYRLSQTAPLEIVAPFWFKTVVRQDLAMMNNRDNMNVSDEEINSWFTSRNLSIQWVYDWQDPTIDRCDIDIPATATLAIYPAGTWAKGGGNVISLDAVYDAANLEVNVYTALFIEESILAVQKCLHTCAVDIPIETSGKGVLDDIDVTIVEPTGGFEPT